MPERDILLSIDLDVQDALKTAGQLQKEVEAIFKSRRGKQSPALSNLQAQIKQTYNLCGDLRYRLNELKQINVWGNDAKTLQEVLVNLKEAEAAYQTLVTAEEEAIEKGSVVIEGQKLTLDELQDKIAKAEQSVKVLTARANTEYELDQTNDKLKTQIIRYEELSKKQINVQKYLDLLVQGFRNLRSILAKLISPLRRVFNTMLSGFRRTQNPMRKMLRMFAVFGLGLNGVMMLIRKVRSAILEGFNNLRESKLSKLIDQVNDLKASFLTLKNTLASAFEPIVTTIIPYLKEMTDKVVAFLDRVAQFIAAARGQKTYVKAVKQTGDALEKMGKQANKALGPLDDLNVIQSESPMFELADISEEVLAEVEAFKDLFSLDNIGVTIGEFVNKIFSNLHEKIKELPDKIEEYFGDWSLTDTFIQIIETVHWDEVGSTIGDGVNFALDTLNNWFKNFQEQDGFTLLGQSAADLFNNLFETIKWTGEGGVGDLLGGLIKGAIDAAWSFATTADFDKWSEKISGAINDFFTKLMEPDENGLNSWQKLGISLGKITAFFVDIFKNLDFKQIWEGFVEGFKTFWNTETTDGGTVGRTITGLVLALSFAKLTFEIGTDLLFSGLKAGLGAALGKAFGAKALCSGVVGKALLCNIPFALTLAVIGATLLLGDKNPFKILGDQLEQVVTESIQNGIQSAFVQNNFNFDEKELRQKAMEELFESDSRLSDYIYKERKGNGWKYGITLAGYIHDFGSGGELSDAINAIVERLKKETTTTVDPALEKAGSSSAKVFHGSFMDQYADSAWERDQRIKDDFEQLAKTFEENGVNCIKGTENGITNSTATNSLSKAVTKTMNKNVKEPAMVALEEHSPSELFEEIGINVLKGFEIGFESETTTLLNMVNSTFNTILSKARAFTTNMSSIMSSYTAGQVIPLSMSSRISMLGSNAGSSLTTNSTDAIQNAVYSALQSMGIDKEQTIILNLDGKEFMRAMVKNNNEYKKQHGGQSAFA